MENWLLPSGFKSPPSGIPLLIPRWFRGGRRGICAGCHIFHSPSTNQGEKRINDTAVPGSWNLCHVTQKWRLIKKLKILVLLGFLNSLKRSRFHKLPNFNYTTELLKNGRKSLPGNSKNDKFVAIKGT
jgi:hypothetical protein